MFRCVTDPQWKVSEPTHLTRSVKEWIRPVDPGMAKVKTLCGKQAVMILKPGTGQRDARTCDQCIRSLG